MTREEAIKFYADEVLFLEIAPKINTCASDEQKEEWKRQAAIHRMAIAALKKEDVTDINVGNKTNADRIRSMTDEELAKLLLDGCRGSKCEDQPENEWGSVNCFRCRMEWLKQPYKEET